MHCVYIIIIVQCHHIYSIYRHLGIIIVVHVYIYIVNTRSYAGDAVCIHVYDAANVFMFVGSAARGQSTLCRRWSAGSGQPVNKSGIKDRCNVQNNVG